MFRSARALALQHSDGLGREVRGRRTALHGGPIGILNDGARSEFGAPGTRDIRTFPNALLARVWPCVIELRIDDALTTVTQFEHEIAGAGGVAALRSREIAAVLRAVLLVLKSHDGATVRAAVAGFLFSLHHATLQDSALPREPGTCIGSIAAGGAPQRTRTFLSRGGTARVADSLSAREHSILRSMSRGLSNKRIAQELQITPETVKSHVKRIFIKLEVQSRAHAVSTASAQGML